VHFILGASWTSRLAAFPPSKLGRPTCPKLKCTHLKTSVDTGNPLKWIQNECDLSHFLSQPGNSLLGFPNWQKWCIIGQIADCRLQIADCELRIADCGLRMASSDDA